MTESNVKIPKVNNIYDKNLFYFQVVNKNKVFEGFENLAQTMQISLISSILGRFPWPRDQNVWKIT